MTVTELERQRSDVATADEQAVVIAPSLTDDVAPAPVVSPTRVTVVGALAASAAGVVLGGMFQGHLGRPAGVLAALLGAGIVGLGIRGGRVLVQYLAAVVVFVAGYVAALVLPNPTGVHGTVPQLVRQAIANGGLAHPPVPFDPGWRFLLVAIVGLVAAAAVSVAASVGKPRLAIALPLPLVLAGALEQPKGHELVGGAIALALVLAALSVSSAADLASRADVSRRFELRQMTTTFVATAIALAVLVGISHASVLFPQPTHSQTAKPQRPQVVPLSQIHDRPLFDAPGPGPWQVGAFTVYEGGNWLLPAYDESRLQPVAGSTGAVPSAPIGPVVSSTLTVRQIGGFTLPTPPLPTAVTGTSVRVAYDPDRSVLRLRDGAAPDGLRYTVTSLALPPGDALAIAARKQPPAALQSYLDVPSPPNAVMQLLAHAPSGNPWDRLQLLRKRLYDHVVATSSGLPVAVTSATVVNELNGGNATPFEIVAAEAILARWVGLPSRIGYGYYDQSKTHGGDFRPADGANWLEVWFDGYGWVPILGTPLRAQSDLNAQHKSQPQIRPAQNQTLQIYVPVLSSDSQLAFTVVRFWAERVIPLLIVLWLAWRSLAIPARALRRRRRREWALSLGPAGRIAVAYATFRDHARDLALDDGRTTPLEFLDRVDDDVEHREFAWLTTRALWGDLARDLRDEDADAAEAMSRSLCARLSRAQPGIARIGALGSRASLRDPWDPALPNAWPQVRMRLGLPRIRLRLPRVLRLVRVRAS